MPETKLSLAQLLSMFERIAAEDEPKPDHEKSIEPVLRSKVHLNLMKYKKKLELQELESINANIELFKSSGLTEINVMSNSSRLVDTVLSPPEVVTLPDESQESAKTKPNYVTFSNENQVASGLSKRSSAALQVIPEKTGPKTKAGKIVSNRSSQSRKQA